MNATELAQGCVKHGIAELQPSKRRDWDYRQYYFSKGPGRSFICNAEQLINDGRVVLAMMQKLSAVQLWRIFEKMGLEYYGAKVSGPAIIEACLQALGGEE